MLLRDREGRTDESLAVARRLAGSLSATGVALYDAACILGKASATIQDPALREQHAALALRALRLGFERGFTEGYLAAGAFRGEEPLAYMQKDPDLAALRERADYRQLVADVEAKKLPVANPGSTPAK